MKLKFQENLSFFTTFSDSFPATTILSSHSENEKLFIFISLSLIKNNQTVAELSSPDWTTASSRTLLCYQLAPLQLLKHDAAVRQRETKLSESLCLDSEKQTRLMTFHQQMLRLLLQTKQNLF